MTAALSPLGLAALAYAERGVAVFPCAPRGKLPAIRKWDGLGEPPAPGWGGNGVKDATGDPDMVRAWWRRLPQANIGLACGHGIWALDLDGPGAAAAVCVRAAVNRQGLPLTAAVETNGGMHLYWAGACPPKNGAPAKVRALKGEEGEKDGYVRPPGLDTRVLGGYVLAPPSVHPTGRVYDWMVSREGQVLDLSALAEAPGWLVEALTPWPAAPAPAGGYRRARAGVSEPDADRQRQRALRYLDAVCKVIYDAPAGQRHVALRDGSLRVGGLVKNGHLSLGEARAALEAAGRDGYLRLGGRWDQSRVQTLDDSLQAGTAWSPGERSK